MTDRRRYTLIAVAIALMAAAVGIGGELARQAFLPSSPLAEIASPAAAASGKETLAQPDPYRTVRLADLDGTGADLLDEYARRAFPGAPPTIPHEIDADGPGGGDCLTCHLLGGWAPSFAAYSPPTPHPRLLDCRQCHLRLETEEVFRANLFRAADPPRIKRAALPGAPPAIPHSLQMRGTCLSCHGGPSAARQIRTPHPERRDCQVCHVTQETATAWRRPGGGPR